MEQGDVQRKLDETSLLLGDATEAERKQAALDQAWDRDGDGDVDEDDLEPSADVLSGKKALFLSMGAVAAYLALSTLVYTLTEKWSVLSAL